MDILSGDDGTPNTRMTPVSGGHLFRPWSYLCRRPASGSAGLALGDGPLPVKGLCWLWTKCRHSLRMVMGPPLLLLQRWAHGVMGDGVVSAAQYHARPVTGAPRLRQASCGLILLRGCLDSLRAKAAGPRVSDVRRDCGQIVPEAAQRRGPRSEAGTKSIPNHLGLLCSPIRSSVAENSKTPNPRPPFSSSPVCLHASHTLAVPCCHPPPSSSPQRDTPWRIDPSPPHRTPSSSDWPSSVDCGTFVPTVVRQRPAAASGSLKREARSANPPPVSISQPPPATTAPNDARRAASRRTAQTHIPAIDPATIAVVAAPTLDARRPALSAVAPRRRPRSSGLVTSIRRSAVANSPPASNHLILAESSTHTVAACTATTALHRALLDI